MVKYLIFCLGAGFLQNALHKQQVGKIDYLPELFLNPYFVFVLATLCAASLLAEVVLGFVLIAWWAGLFLWIPAFIVTSLLVPSPNPTPPFFIGIAIVVASTISFFF